MLSKLRVPGNEVCSYLCQRLPLRLNRSFHAARRSRSGERESPLPSLGISCRVRKQAWTPADFSFQVLTHPTHSFTAVQQSGTPSEELLFLPKQTCQNTQPNKWPGEVIILLSFLITTLTNSLSLGLILICCISHLFPTVVNSRNVSNKPTVHLIVQYHATKGNELESS